ncbi:SPOSA6832_04093, partial [Sporobolomyces salmonicolor]
MIAPPIASTLPDPTAPVASTSTASFPTSSPSGPHGSFQLISQWLDVGLPTPPEGEAAGWARVSHDTLAVRRMKAARERPQVVRRRSRSDDGAYDGSLEAEPIRIDPTPFVDRAVKLTVSPLTATSDSSYAASEIPTSSTSSSFATTAPSPYTPCPMTPCFSLDTSMGTFAGPPLQLVTRSLSDTALAAIVDGSSSNRFPPLHPPQPHASPSPSHFLAKSFSAADHRLANWVKLSSLPFVTSPHGSSPVESPASTVKLPLPPRQPFTPVLPSPLSTSYTSDDDRSEDGFPFPPTPVLPSFEHSDTASSAAASGSMPGSSASSPAAASTRSAPVTSPVLRRDTFSRTLTSTTSTTASTPTIKDVASPLCSARPQPRRSLSESGESISIPAPSSSSISRSTSIRSSSMPSPAAAPHPVPVNAQHRHSVPLTPPDSLCTGPFLANASASELAWHDVLGSRLGSLGLPTAARADVASRVDGKGKGREPARWDKATPEDDEQARKAAGGAAGANELMNTVGGGHFATTTRERLAKLIQEHVGDVPLRKEDSVVQIVEYGAINSRSAALVPPVLAHFASRHLDLLSSRSSSSSTHSIEPPSPVSALSDDSDESALSFSILHTDKPNSDFRALSQSLESSTSSSESYLHADPGLDGRVFSTFAARPFGSKVVPKGSVSVGFSAMSLHWPSTDRKYRVAPATLAHGELMAFLSARAFEFMPGGLLALAYIARTEECANAASSPSSYSPGSSSPTTTAASLPLLSSGAGTSMVRGNSGQQRSASTPVGVGAGPGPAAGAQPRRKRDIWAVLTGVLGKAIQRLVSTGLLKPQVARQLLALPLHPRTPRQTLACVRASAHSWDLLHSSLLTLSHPAWKGVEHGTVSRESWADHTIQLLKIFWESEMRAILKDALGSRGACEWVLDCLWTVAKEKVEEDPPHPLELEVQVLALRRRSKNSPPSNPTSPRMT